MKRGITIVRPRLAFERKETHSIIALRFTFDELKYVARTGNGAPYGFIPDPHPQIIESLRTHEPEWTPDVEDGMSLIYFVGNPSVLLVLVRIRTSL